MNPENAVRYDLELTVDPAHMARLLAGTPLAPIIHKHAGRHQRASVVQTAVSTRYTSTAPGPIGGTVAFIETASSLIWVDPVQKTHLRIPPNRRMRLRWPRVQLS